MRLFHCKQLMFLMLGSLLLTGCTLFETHSQPAPVAAQPPAEVQREKVIVHEPVIIRETPLPPPSNNRGWAWQSGHWELQP